MKKQQLKSVLHFTKATIVNFNNREQIKGGFGRTGESCFEACDTQTECSWGAE
ncbi:hypothetical protein H2O64_15470 [Kordia sp. YSTF-M3]|uniref:Natural product n=1 Tax=Kordia aestuariivivens TaxID=2759037 RepID=A0ABR7QBY7_9FLAO|nr:hypothetical protein [Kordia aestuariivivens]MBC8756076.1 hypothetical protein [Kordia aestuariivivens]